MVVKETRIIFGLDVVVGVRIQCHQCNGEIVREPQGSGSMHLPELCPLCGKPWGERMTNYAFQSFPYDLQRFVKELKDDRIKVPVTIRLELDGKSVE